MRLIVNCLRNSKNSIEILKGQAVFKVVDQNKMFGSITQEPPGLPKF